MKDVVSKVRARRAKSRDKQAGRPARRRTLDENPLVSLGLVVLLWLVVVVILASEHLLGRKAGLDVVLPLAAQAGFALVGLVAAGIFLGIVQPRVLERNSRLLMLGLIGIIPLAAAKGLLAATPPESWMGGHDALVFLLPFALAPLLATILLGGATGVAVGVWTSLLLTIVAGRDFSLFLTGIVATVVAASMARRVRTRAKVFRIGLAVGLSEMACLFGITGLSWQSADLGLILHQAGACLVSGFLSAVAVLLILPLFELLFRVTTDITLLELSDLGHPLLQRLAMEAPGTYHHSLVVASLAQAAADEIGANSLLARVASYFHDIGKLTKPDFFAENIRMQENPHDDLAPSMSTLVITAHVKEGLSLGMLHKLPRPVMAVIAEHHGTSLLSYFHHKAKTQMEFELTRPDGTANGGETVDEGAFRYAGPRPSSRESSIICLADAVEAASRSMEKTTPGHIENLVSDIVNTRLEDGQLDHCDLKLEELTRIKRSFVFTLTNMLHGRVPYPKDEDRDKQQSKTVSIEPGETKKPGPATNGTGPAARS